MWLVASVLGSAGLDIGMTHPRRHQVCKEGRLLRVAVSCHCHASNQVRERWALRPDLEKAGQVSDPKSLNTAVVAEQAPLRAFGTGDTMPGNFFSWDKEKGLLSQYF